MKHRVGIFKVILFYNQNAMLNPKSNVMKTKLSTLLLIPFFALLMFTSCQDEEIDITPPDETETLVAESTLTSLISATSIMDGSADNIIDNASCLSVELPVTVIVRGLEITIDSTEDFKVIEAIFKELDDDEDTLDIVFPITIILANHHEVVIQNREALDELIDECRGENEEDDDIECIDFQYPISFSVYNTDFQVINTITIENDRELYKFIKRVSNAEVFASLNFPVTMELADGTEIVVNNNTELQRAIEEAKDTCDEDDDNDYGDDDFTKERLDQYLKTCPWVVYEFERNNEDKTDLYKEYALNFKENDSVVMRAREGNILTGTWSTRVTDRGALLKLEFDALVDFTLEWFVYDIEDGIIKLFEEGGNRIIMKRRCDVVIAEITKERIKNYLKECFWRVDSLSVNNIRKENDYIGTPLKFFDDDVVKLRVNGELIEGTYDIGLRNTGYTLQMTLDGRPDLKLEWLISFLTEDLVVLYNENNAMILKRHCIGAADDIDPVLISGIWEVSSYMELDADLTANYEGYVIMFNEGGKLFAEGQGNNYIGSWFAYRDDQLFFLGMHYGINEPFKELNDRWRVKEITSDRIELKDYSANGEIERVLVLEKKV